MKKYTHKLLGAFALLVLPTSVQALSIDTLDTVAGLATEVVISEAIPQEQIQLSIRSPLGETFSHTLNVGSEGVAHTWIAGSDLEVAGLYELQAQEATAVLNVHSDSVDVQQSYISMSANQVSVGEEILVAVILVDQYGNPLSGRMAELISSQPGDSITPRTRETNAYGEQEFVIRTAQEGQRTLRAMDLISAQTINDAPTLLAGNITTSMGGPTQVAYNAPPRFYPDASAVGASLLGQTTRFQTLDHFEIRIGDQLTSDIAQVRLNEAEDVRITAMDQDGNVFQDYEGTVYMASTDPTAELPKDGVIEFGFANQGVRKFPLVLKFGTAGSHMVILTDSPNAAPQDPRNDALGYLEVEVVGKQIIDTPDIRVSIAEPKSNAVFNETDIMVTGNGPAFINLVAVGGLEEVTGETDRDGNFAIPIKLDPTKTEHSIVVRDADGRYESLKRTFTIDVTPPAIESIALTPEAPIEETDVLLVVQTEPNSPSVIAEFNGEEYTLTSTDPSTGKYQMLLQAPVGGGEHGVTITATDAIGNVATESTSFTVGLRGLPQVRSVIAEAQINAIGLRWDPVEDEDIDAYRIYVGTDPNEFLYTLDTDRPTAAATVAGLRPGTTYYFGITALQEGRESELKSEIVSATVLGLNLDVTPGDGSLFVEWSALSSDVPLSTFLLEYGVEPDQFTEKRTLNGDLRAYTLRDLINGISYYMRLTPITTTGDLLEDLAANGQGTPIGQGFTAAPGDPIPTGFHGSATEPPPKTPDVPVLDDTGIPGWMLWAVLATSIALFQWHLRRKKALQMNAAFLQAMQSRYNQ